MEAKTLFRLIKDDIAHLEGITSEFNLETMPSYDEVELALVRANALLRELELLHKITAQHESSSKIIKLSKEPKVEVKEQDHSEQEPFELFDRETGEDEQEKIFNSHQEYLIPAEELQDTKFHTDKQHIEELHEVSIDASPAQEHFTALVEPAESGDVSPVSPIVTEEEVEDHKEEILAEEFNEIKKMLNETLGESHQMVNDILSPEKNESGYQIIPIKSIWDGIGINDRFLFIRELFANSNTKFETTVAALDKLATIQDAVNYLKMNFKWNKTEASQKFLDLVKRRFTK